MKLFECQVGRTVISPNLIITRGSTKVHVSAKDETEARKKAVNPENWLNSGRADVVQSPLTVESVRELSDDEAKAFSSGH